jgi:hypothetical protein
MSQGIEEAMLNSFIAAALALQPAAASPPVLSQENRALLRCAAAFAVVSNRQTKGDATAQQWPALGTRGREFFVRTMAQLMDRSGLDRAGIAALASSEAEAMVAKGEVDQVMPVCLAMLEASGV